MQTSTGIRVPVPPAFAGDRPRRAVAQVATALALVLASAAFTAGVAWLVSAATGAAPPALAAMCRWDCEWYRSIVDGGYHVEPIEHPFHPHADVANWAFFPAFPMAARAVAAATGASPPVALVLTGATCLVLGVLAFMAYAERELGPGARLPAGAIVAFDPYLVYAFSGYTEPLYFLLTTLAFLLLSRGRTVAAGAVGALLSATRIVGVLLLASIAAKAIAGWRAGERPDAARLALAVLLVPLGLAAYMAFLHRHVGDALAFKHVMLSWDRVPGDPLATLVRAVSAGGWSAYFAAVAVGGLAVAAWLALERRVELAVFLLGAILVPLSTGLVSMPRYVFWQMPLLFGLLALMMRHRLLRVAYVPFAAAVAAGVVFGWVTGRDFVT